MSREVALIVDEKADVDHGWLLEYVQEVASGLELELQEPPGHHPAATVVLFECDVLAETVSAAAAGGVPTVWVDLADADRPLGAGVPDLAPLIRGRGIEGLRWAFAQAARLVDHEPKRVAYGSGRDRFYDVRVPVSGVAPHPVALLLHGGFWRERWTLDTIEPLAVDLATRGFATCNVEYRRVGRSGGVWPASEEDVATALRQVASDTSGLFDSDRIVVIGHSAGAQLAYAGTARAGVGVRLIVSLAGVLDLRLCAQRGLGDTGNAARAYVGGESADADERYRRSSPAELPILGARELIVQGLDDSPDLIEMARRHVARVDDVRSLELPGDHFAVITPSSEIWQATAREIEQALMDRPAGGQRPGTTMTQ